MCLPAFPEGGMPANAQPAPLQVGDFYVQPSVRITQTINRNWTFNYFPASRVNERLAAPDTDDDSWPAVSLPHTWQTYETTGELHPFILHPSERDDPYWWYGFGWYRKRFEIAPEHRGRRVFVEFDGVQKYSRIYLNGSFVGEHKGGYNSFSFDLTELIQWNGGNVLSVAVSNRRDDRHRIPPMTAGNFNLYGGIYRDVRLILTDPLHVPYQGNAGHDGGTFITTPTVNHETGIVRVRTFVQNGYIQSQNVYLRTVVTDSAGVVVTSANTTAQMKAGEVYVFDQTSKPISEPNVWAPETPYVYSVHTEVWCGERLVDTYSSPLGFRWFHWDRASNVLYLNGHPVHIHGTNRHQEYPWLGDALPKWLHEEELRQIRYDLDMNFMRATHYPNDPLLYDLTDQFGIITVEEVPNIKSIDFSEDVQEANVRAMVRRDRNHPSILFWSLGNETDDPAAGSWVWEEDSTRIIHLRHGPEGDPYVTHTHEDLEMENQLRVTIRGWTDDSVKEARPENGQHAGTETWQHERMRTHENGRARIDEDIVHWLYADHGADREYKNAPVKHVNPKGWLDLYRIPKYGYYLWKANWSDDDVLFVHPHVWQQANIGQAHDIVVDTNTDYVELFVNGRSFGREKPNRANFYTVTFKNVPVEEGILAVEGTRRDRVVRDTVHMPGPPARLVLTTSQDSLFADRAGIAVVTVDIVDSDGVPVRSATNPLTWHVSDPGKLVGPDLYTSDIDRHEAVEGTMYITTPVKNLVRTTANPGIITVRVSAPGLEPGEVRILSRATKDPPRSGIFEPHLFDEGRQPVKRDAGYMPGEDLGGVEQIEPTNESVTITGESLRDGIRDFVLANNMNIDTTTVAYQTLEDRLVTSLVRTNGLMIEDDYNFLVSQFNAAIVLTRYIEELPVHPRFKVALYDYYASGIIQRGAARTLVGEKEWLAPLFGGSRMILVTPDLEGEALQYFYVPDYYEARAGDLETLILLNYPEFQNVSEIRKERIFVYLDAVNPHIVREGDTYRLVPNEPIVIPVWNTLNSL